jgi:hypothetical protein
LLSVVLDDLKRGREHGDEAQRSALVPSAPSERYDFFLSRRGSVAHIAQEVADVLTENDYRVLVQDYNFPLGTSFVDAMHEGIKVRKPALDLSDIVRQPRTVISRSIMVRHWRHGHGVARPR